MTCNNYNRVNTEPKYWLLGAPRLKPIGAQKILPNNLSCTMLRLQCITVLLMSGGKIHSLINIGMSSDWTPSYKVRTLLRMV